MSPEAEIRRRIGEQGRITFSEFMELALFWPQGGYYLRPGTLEASGDYYTSPQAHPAFAALLAVQLLQMWSLLDEPDPFTVVEIGAGNGLLCRDLVAYSCHLPQAFRRALRYLCLDRNLASGLEQEVFTGNGAAVGRVAASIIASGPASTGQPEAAGLPLRGIRGCFLSNELLDAFPVHQVTKVDGRLLEVYVTLRDGELATVTAAPSTPMLVARLESLRVELIEGQTAEINLGIDSWARQVAGALEAGFVLTIDYGHQAEELYSAERRLRGTLTTYFRHTQTDSPLRRIGRQDITAQVDFTSAQELGEQAGLDVLG
ncbi:MAG: SAM-dependent methyltransferase, partial [Chloroflexi bacterium]|nr:SAM-dependent methyltransferase [Chloroflexota bacterium]